MELVIRMQRYFTERKKENIFTLSKEDTYHLTTVMRKKEQDKIEIVYQNELYLAKVVKLAPLVEAEILQKEKIETTRKSEVTIVQSLVKEQKMDYILQKTTELGVSKIIPFQAERSVVKLECKEIKKLERWQKILKEASEQSKRENIPIIEKIASLEEVCNLSEYDVKFLCTVKENSQNLKKILSNRKGSAKMLFVIGPEGGFTDNEEEAFLEHGFLPISLGDTVLRTETASTFIMSVIRYLDMR